MQGDSAFLGDEVGAEAGGFATHGWPTGTAGFIPPRRIQRPCEAKRNEFRGPRVKVVMNRSVFVR